jgi:8-oxo-dGTP pyrophosphatase MutT (NUDIX family)
MNLHEGLNISEAIRSILRGRSPRLIHDEGNLYRHAGVLVPLLIENYDCRVLFTKRTHRVEEHKGQISFPGGSVDDEDSSFQDTALREANEEIGLLKEDVDILGRLDDTLTVASNFVVHPFVGSVPYPYDFTINHGEVERLIEVPLCAFDPAGSDARRDVVEIEGMTYWGCAYEYEGDVIWGATARMMENLMEITKDKLSCLGGENTL